MAERVYAKKAASESAQAQATQPEDIAATPDSNGVVDAEFEEVKDDK